MRMPRTDRLPAPLGDMLLFVATVAGFLILWRVSGNAVDCVGFVAALGCAVGAGWHDSYRRARRDGAAAAGGVRTP